MEFLSARDGIISPKCWTRESETDSDWQGMMMLIAKKQFIFSRIQKG